MNPEGWEALYCPSGQDGCTDGTLASLPKGRQNYSFFNKRFFTFLKRETNISTFDLLSLVALCF